MNNTNDLIKLRQSSKYLKTQRDICAVTRVTMMVGTYVACHLALIHVVTTPKMDRWRGCIYGASIGLFSLTHLGASKHMDHCDKEIMSNAMKCHSLIDKK